MQDITVSNAFDPNVLLMSGYLSRMKNQTVQPDISDALSIASANTESESFGSFFYSLPDSMFVYETYMIECSGYSLVDYDTGIDINSQTMIIGGMSVIPDKPTVGAESIKKDVYGTQDCRAVRDTVSGTWHLLVGMEGVLPYEQLKITRVLSCFLIGNEYVTILPDQFADLQGMSRGSAAGIPEGLY
jgi:hypothetical protein